MGVLSSLFTGVSGLSAQGEALSIVSDNIANSNTTGFKASRAEFQDVISKNLKGILGGNQIGRGVKIGAVNPILLQGNVDATENSTDLAISGDGYFTLRGSDGQSFTRDGSLHFDRNGYMVTNDDQRVQGYVAEADGKVTSNMSDIQLPKSIIPAKGTKKIDIGVQLDSRYNIGVPFNIEKPNDTAQFSTGVELYDSQGNKHLMMLFFNKVADRQWQWHGLVDGREVTGGKEGMMSEVATGTLGFTVDGKLDTQVVSKKAFNFAGGALPNQDIDISFGDAITTNKGKGLKGSVQYGKDSDMMSWRQDGAAAGNITNMSFDDLGRLTALYSNGEARVIYQLVLSKFDAPERLYKVGNNRFKESTESGTPSIGAPGASGRGRIFAKSLERSTVDLALEFVNLIQNQRGFQANAKTISTTDELMNEIIQLKR